MTETVGSLPPLECCAWALGVLRVEETIPHARDTMGRANLSLLLLHQCQPSQTAPQVTHVLCLRPLNHRASGCCCENLPWGSAPRGPPGLKASRLGESRDCGWEEEMRKELHTEAGGHREGHFAVLSVRPGEV